MADNDPETTILDSSELVVRYRYSDGVLLDGDSYPHKDAIKTATPQWRWFRSLRQWGVPRKRERVLSREHVEQYVDGLVAAGVPKVRLDYAVPTPEDVRDFDEVVAEDQGCADTRAGRLEARADRLAAQAQLEQDKSHDIVSGIPMGQPILVGHHSQRRHEGALERSGRAMDRAVDADREARRARRGARIAKSRGARRESPPFAIRRLREIDADLRKLEMQITGQPPKGWWGTPPAGPATGEWLTQLQTRQREAQQRRAYFRGVLEAEHVPATTDVLRGGDEVMTERGPATVRSVSAKAAKVVYSTPLGARAKSVSLARLWLPKTALAGRVEPKADASPPPEAPPRQQVVDGLWTTEEEGFALVSPQGDGRRVAVPRGHQPALFDVGKPDREFMEQRRAAELVERRARRGPVDTSAPLLEAAANDAPPGAKPSVAGPVVGEFADKAAPLASTGRPPTEQLPEPTARLEYVDVVTGEPTPATEPGTRSTGRIVAEIGGETVPIDEEDLIGRGTDPNPRTRRYQYDARSPADYPGQARAKKAARATTKTKRSKKATQVGLRKTFDSAAKAAQVFYDHNEDFFDHVRDPWDGLRDWMDGIEVRVGVGHRKLAQTAAGKRILGERHAAKAIRKAIAYVLGRAKGRRWEQVQWFDLDRLGEALAPYYDAPTSGTGRSDLYWRPFTGEVRAEDLDAMSPEQRASIRDQESVREIGDQLEELRPAYARAKECLPADLRKTVERRIRQWSAWVKDPSKIPDYACEPDPKTAGYLCNYPAVAGELAQLRRSCDDAYDPDWAANDSKRGEPGFPDTSGGEDETRSPRKVSAKACCSGAGGGAAETAPKGPGKRATTSSKRESTEASTERGTGRRPATKSKAKPRSAAKPKPPAKVKPPTKAKPAPGPRPSSKPRKQAAATAAERKAAAAERRKAAEQRRKLREAQRRADRLTCSAAVVSHQARTIDAVPYRHRFDKAGADLDLAEEIAQRLDKEFARVQRDARMALRDKQAKPVDRQRARRRIHEARCRLRTAKGAIQQRKRDKQRADTELRRVIARIHKREALVEKRERAAEQARAKADKLARKTNQGKP